MAKKPVGRPTKLTPENIAKLEQAYLNGATDLEACFAADISKTALYDYQQKHPEFTERKEKLKGALSLKAKNVLAQSINNGNVQDAKWHLERKNKKEYSTQINSQTLDENGDPALPITEININLIDPNET